MLNIVITGGSRGIGKSISKYFSKRNNVINLSRTKVRLKNIKNIKCDISNFASVKKAFSKIKKIDVLINNAGITYYCKDDILNFDKIIDVNLKGCFYCCKYAIPLLLKSKNSSIINIASINSVLAFPNNPGYVSSKAAIVSLTRSLALDNGHKGLRVNSISPGYINDGIAKKSFLNSKARKVRISRMILKRFGRSEDLFGAIDFLISKNSSYITGQNIIIDGGWTVKGL